MDEPPSEDGAEKATDNCEFPTVIPVIVAALGVVAGVPLVLAQAVPSPTLFTAFICTE